MLDGEVHGKCHFTPLRKKYEVEAKRWTQLCTLTSQTPATLVKSCALSLTGQRFTKGQVPDKPNRSILHLPPAWR